MNFDKLLFGSVLIFLISFFLTPATLAQTDTLAIVNGEPITKDEFTTRFELTVYPGKGLKADLSDIKRKFLYSLVAEKLLSNQYITSSAVPDPDENQIKDEIEAIFLRDALYRKEVLSQVKVGEKELKTGVRYAGYDYITDAVYFPDSLWADSFFQKVKSGEKKYFYHVCDSLNLCHDTLQIGYGESDETIENAFFARDTGYVSNPTNTVDGWIVFRVINKKPDGKFSSASPSEKAKIVHDLIAYRKSYRLGRDYLLNVMKGVEVNVNYRIFNPLVYKIKSILATHRPTSFEGGYYLSRQELRDLKDTFSFDPRAPILRFKSGELQLGYIFDNLSLAGFAPSDTSVREITFALHSALKFIIQNYFLAQKALELGLQESPEVKYNTRTFLDAYRSNRLITELVDTVKITSNEVNNYFESHKDEVLKDIELRVQIFSLDNIDEAADVLNRLNKSNKLMPDTTGAIWLRASQLGEIGAVIAELDNGGIYGPIFLNGKFTIFRLLEKRSEVGREDINRSIQAAKDLLLEQKRNEVINKYIARLTSGQPTKIFESKLENVDVTPIQMLTFRYIGFGGKIIATPSLYPREEWIKYLKDKQSILP